jgi:hypothetical protein
VVVSFIGGGKRTTGQKYVVWVFGSTFPRVSKHFKKIFLDVE